MKEEKCFFCGLAVTYDHHCKEGSEMIDRFEKEWVKKWSEKIFKLKREKFLWDKKTRVEKIIEKYELEFIQFFDLHGYRAKIDMIEMLFRDAISHCNALLYYNGKDKRFFLHENEERCSICFKIEKQKKYTLKQAAECCGVSRETFWSWFYASSGLEIAAEYGCTISGSEKKKREIRYTRNGKEVRYTRWYFIMRDIEGFLEYKINSIYNDLIQRRRDPIDCAREILKLDLRNKKISFSCLN